MLQVGWTVFRARRTPHTPSASEQLDGKKLLSVKEIVKPHTTKVACFRGFSPRTSFPPYSGNSAFGSLRCQGRIQANERG